MFHAEVSSCTEGERGDGGVRTEETFVVAMVGYAVGAGCIIIHQAKVVSRFGKDLGELAQMIKTLWYGAWSRGFIAVWWYRFGCLAID